MDGARGDASEHNTRALFGVSRFFRWLSLSLSLAARGLLEVFCLFKVYGRGHARTANKDATHHARVAHHACIAYNNRRVGAQRNERRTHTHKKPADMLCEDANTRAHSLCVSMCAS